VGPAVPVRRVGEEVGTARPAIDLKGYELHRTPDFLTCTLRTLGDQMTDSFWPPDFPQTYRLFVAEDRQELVTIIVREKVDAGHPPLPADLVGLKKAVSMLSLRAAWSSRPGPEPRAFTTLWLSRKASRFYREPRGFDPPGVYWFVGEV
jgi:hypothetical protein